MRHWMIRAMVVSGCLIGTPGSTRPSGSASPRLALPAPRLPPRIPSSVSREYCLLRGTQHSCSSCVTPTTAGLRTLSLHHLRRQRLLGVRAGANRLGLSAERPIPNRLVASACHHVSARIRQLYAIVTSY